VIRDVVLVPDARLKQVCAPARDVLDQGAIEELARDLLDTMRAFPGCVGIAAPQVGELVRMFAIDVTGHKKAESCAGEQVLIDPIVVQSSGSIRMREGCLSIPDFTGDVTRAERVVVSASTTDGMPVEISCDAYEARVILHELDHLDGVLFLDRVDSARDVYPRKRYR
jgi:peptide deformylase